MKKLFVFAIAATCVVAACNKNPLPTPEDETPVAVQFNTKTIDASVTRTKAAIDAWTGNEELHIYGFAVNRQGGTDDGAQIALGSGRYDLDNPFINNVSAQSPSQGTELDVDNPNGQDGEPFYYDINTSVVYDFYGYYFGTADLGEASKANDAITYPVTIDGTQDLLYATTDKATDVQKDDQGRVAVHQAYGSWAARRDVQPTLNFKHALSQFTFNVKKGVGSYSGTLTVEEIQIVGSNKGNLTVVGENLGYVAAADDDQNDSFKLSSLNIVPGTNDYSPVQGVLMVAPNQASVTVKVTMGATLYSPNDGKIVYEFELPANSIDGKTAFLAGESYKVNIIVYGPEEVKFEVDLAPWTPGGEINYNPDDDNNAPAE